MKHLRRALWIILALAAVITVFLLAIYINHRIRCSAEAELRALLGQLVEVNGGNMSVYTEGTGLKTLVFMSGAGTCSPILDFKSLYSLLSGQYRIAVVEKFGYGFSDVAGRERDIDTVLEDTRAALRAARIEAPYVLCPHSMSGLEALYWAQKYPDEVAAIIGLDMAVPQYYSSMEINLTFMRLAQWAAETGITRLIPGIAESDAIKGGTLSETEKEIYRALFYTRTATVDMINEAEAVRENAKTVESRGVPQVPMLLFLSDGSGGTGFDKETWRSIPKEYIAQIANGAYVELECPHYVHDYEYTVISKKILEFLSFMTAQPAGYPAPAPTAPR